MGRAKKVDGGIKILQAPAVGPNAEFLRKVAQILLERQSVLKGLRLVAS